MGLLHVRYDEVGLKGGNRPLFEKRLRKNLNRILRLKGGSVRRTRGRILVETGEKDPRTVLPDVARCFGVASASPVVIVPRDEASIYAAAVELAREAVAAGKKTFKVEARRGDKSYPLTSVQLAPKVGSAVLTAIPGLKVSLHQPEFTIGVEVGKETAALHAFAISGPGGVPVGISGRALVLLSGGIDSPVAAWYTLKRGLSTDFVYFHSFPYTGDKTKEKVLGLARELSRWAPEALFAYVPSFTHVQDAIADLGTEELRTVLLRRFMYRVSAKIADMRGHKALVTGEALGQVASQTPENLLCVEVVVPGTLVLRPLIGFDKVEVVARAKAINTFETSILPYEDCCSLFSPRHPTTRATVERCAEAESRLDVAALEEESMALAEVWRVKHGDAPEKLEGAIRKRADWVSRGVEAKKDGVSSPEKDERESDERPAKGQSADDDVMATDLSEG